VSRWRYGCDAPVTLYVPRGYDYRAVARPCGSTGPQGEVVQCPACAAKYRPPAPPDYGDDERDDRDHEAQESLYPRDDEAVP
jgi:hypothetical protein